MPSAVKTYTPSDVSLTIAGYRVGGVVSMSMTFPAERFKIVQGIKGHNVRVRNLDTSCILNVELLQTSIMNDLFTNILSQDLTTGLGRFEINIEDLNGTTKVQSVNAYISTFPETRFSNNLETRSWTIHMLNTDYISVGGNDKGRPQFLEDIGAFLGKTASEIAGAAQSAVQTVTDLF